MKKHPVLKGLGGLILTGLFVAGCIPAEDKDTDNKAAKDKAVKDKAAKDKAKAAAAEVTAAKTKAGAKVAGAKIAEVKAAHRRRIAQLTDRQKKILSILGAAGQYDQLTSSQKDRIRAIDEMLGYLEEKYGKEFMFASFYASDEACADELIAYPADGTPEDSFSVTRAGETFTDTYTEE